MKWSKVGSVVGSWVVSPVVGGTISFLLVMSTRKLIFDTDDPLKNAKRYAPCYVFLVGFVISLVTMFKGLKHLKVDLSVPQSFGVAVIIVTVIIRIVIWPLHAKSTRTMKRMSQLSQTYS